MFKEAQSQILKAWIKKPLNVKKEKKQISYNLHLVVNPGFICTVQNLLSSMLYSRPELLPHHTWYLQSCKVHFYTITLQSLISGSLLQGYELNKQKRRFLTLTLCCTGFCRWLCLGVFNTSVIITDPFLEACWKHDLKHYQAANYYDKKETPIIRTWF